MPNIFDQAPEFIEWDNRKDREINRVTAESTYNRTSVQVPTWLVKNSTVLDLGSCLGALGHVALTNSAKHYTAVEIQEKYVNQSRELFTKYWKPEQYTIVQENLETFLDNAIANNIQYDHVIASGVLYAFLNVISIIEKISKVAKVSVLIDTLFVGATSGAERGVILLRPGTFINYAEGQQTFVGLGSALNLKALDMLMKYNLFQRTENRIIPPITKNSHDGYSDLLDHTGEGIKLPSRYMARYYRQDSLKFKVLQDKIIENDISGVQPFYRVENIVRTGADLAWKFDSNVANRFQQEAEQHIPDYNRVIDLCLDIARDNLRANDQIIDVGSALGYTVDKFLSTGFTNVYGVDNSESMIAQSLHKDRITLSDYLPDQIYQMIMINWTLHFILDKVSYLKDVYNKLSPNGILIITDKTGQSNYVQDLYYKFKENNGVDPVYIKQKQQALSGIMHTVSPSWYFTQLEEIGFTRVEVINARLGFITFICRKS